MRIRVAPALLAGVLALTGCASRSLSPDDLQWTCRFGIEQKVSSPAFKVNPLSNVAGGIVGAGLGAGLLFPIGIPLGAIGGSACAAGSLAHPTADADFTRLVGEADFAAFQRALDERLHASRDACRSADPVAALRSSNDATVTVDTATAGMGCLYGHHQYWLAMKWHVTDARTGRELASSTTACVMRSWRTVDDWFADPAYAKKEIERLMAGTGTAVGSTVLGVAGTRAGSICEFTSHESGELEMEQL